MIKNSVWSYEKEWRYLFYMTTPKPFNNHLQLIKFPTPTAIYLGKNFIKKWYEENKKELFFNFCNVIKEKNIKLYIMNNSILSYELTSKEINIELLERINENILYDYY